MRAVFGLFFHTEAKCKVFQMNISLHLGRNMIYFQRTSFALGFETETKPEGNSKN